MASRTTTRTMKWAVAAAGVAGAAAATAVAYVQRERVLRFAHYGRELSAAGYDELASRAGWSKTETKLDDGIVVRGLVRRPRGAEAPWIVFFPGNSDHQLEESQGFLEALLAGDDGGDRGAVVFTYRGYDGSPGTPSRDALARDAARVLRRWLEAERISSERAHVVGFSLGAYTALAAASEVRPRTLTLLAPFTVIDIAPGGPGRWSALRGRLSAERYDVLPLLDRASEADVETLVVHGERDTTLPLAMGQEVASKLGSRSRFVEVPGADHAGLLLDERALAEVRGFVSGAGRPST